MVRTHWVTYSSTSDVCIYVVNYVVVYQWHYLCKNVTDVGVFCIKIDSKCIVVMDFPLPRTAGAIKYEAEA